MKKVSVAIILLIIIVVTVVAYYFIAHFGTLYMAKMNSQSANNPSSLCQKNQLSTSLSAQGAAGNIYDTLVLINKGKTACTIILGNTVTAQFSATNIVTHYVENISSQNFVLAPSVAVYSQVHYPNGPQCQSGIKPQPINFFYQTDQVSVLFASDTQTGKMAVQACNSPTEKTTVDIWPLSKQPITP